MQPSLRRFDRVGRWVCWCTGIGLSVLVAGCTMQTFSKPNVTSTERQITFGDYGHILTNVNVWSPDSQWIVYDVRSDASGEVFDGDRIERVNVDTGQVQVLYQAVNGAKVGVATYSPTQGKVVFIKGPEHPTKDWSYAANHRQGVVVAIAKPGEAVNLDARDLTPPFTPGALRGGTHVHVFSPDGQWVSFTYEDAILPPADTADISEDADVNARNIGVSIPAGPVVVDQDHPRNHGGSTFSVLVTHTVRNPTPGSDEISRACEEGWVGTNGYVRADGTRQRHAIAFQGTVRTADGKTISEVFIADLPDDLTHAGKSPLEGTQTRMPVPPAGVVQRRLTFTADRRFPGIQGPRHWLRSSPDGSQIAFLMKDERGLPQLWTVSPMGGAPRQLTNDAFPVQSAFTWNPSGDSLSYVADGSVFAVQAATGISRRLTPRRGGIDGPMALTCVCSPSGNRIAYIARCKAPGGIFNQIFVAAIPPSTR